MWIAGQAVPGKLDFEPSGPGIIGAPNILQTELLGEYEATPLCSNACRGLGIDPSSTRDYLLPWDKFQEPRSSFRSQTSDLTPKTMLKTKLFIVRTTGRITH